MIGRASRTLLVAAFAAGAAACASSISFAQQTGGMPPPAVVVEKVEVKSVDYFGPRIGFVNLAVDAELTESGQKPPGLVFMVTLRGGRGDEGYSYPRK